jgi:hypothetical protein
MTARRARRAGAAVLVASLLATAALSIGGGAVLAAAPPPSWTFDLSANNVVPGPGDSSLEDSQGYLSASDTPGELCPAFDVPFDATGAGIYQASAGSTGPLVVDLSSYLGDYQCAEDVPQATIDDLAANPADYYVQISSDSFPDGATRGQLAIVVPTIYMDALAFFCPTGTTFPASDKTLAKQCGAMSIPGQDFAPEPGYTSVDYAGTFPWDVEVQGPAGYDAHLADAALNAGGFCTPDTLTCNLGSLPFTFFDLQPGPTTVDVSAVPAGMKLAYAHATIEGRPDIAVTYGAGGHVSFDMTDVFDGTPIVRYYFTGSAKVAPPSELPPVAHLAQAPVASSGAVALGLTYGASTLGSGSVSYAVQVSTDGGTFKAAAAGPKPLATVSELPGHSYQFRVQATNTFGVKSAWVAGDTLHLDAIQDTDAQIQYSADEDGWRTASSKGALGGTTTWANDSTADASLSIDAAEIAIVMPHEPGGGTGSVGFNGDYRSVALSAGSWQPRQVVALRDFGGVGTQQVDIRPSGDGRVDLDEIVILH